MSSESAVVTPSGPGKPSTGRNFRTSVRAGIADYKSNYTVKSWTLGWLMRLMVEVLFFALIGVLLQNPEVTLFLVIGGGLFLGVMEMMWVIQSTAWERYTGTLPLLVSAPGRVWAAFAGRSTQWFPSSLATSLIALFVLARCLGFVTTPPKPPSSCSGCSCP